jgi:DNA-binding CsgD family transcriptional regulator
MWAFSPGLGQHEQQACPGWKAVREGTGAGVVSPVFVGRAAEIAALEEALAATPRTVLISGEAGVGKSRLVQEFATRVAGCARVLTGGCAEVDGLAYAPFTAVLRQLVGEIGACSVAALLPGGEPGELARLLPDLGRAEVEADVEMARSRLFERTLTLVERIADRSAMPVVLVLEDVHWADRSSRDLLSFLIRNQRTAQASLIAVTYRCDELDDTHPLRGLLADLDHLGWVQRLDVPRLAKRDVIAQARGILGREPDPARIEEIYRRTEGNPLFVEVLLGHEGRDLPESLRDLLLTRIRRLPEETRQVLRVAAAGGVRVGHRLLASVAALDDAALARVLRPAVAANLLVVDAEADTYAFRHALIREAVYEDLLPGERITLHARYGNVLDNDQAAHRELARHWYAARDAPRALAAAWRAAAEAKRALAYTEQLHMLDRVLELWSKVPDAAERTGLDRTAVVEQAVAAADRAGEHERGECLATAALGGIDPDREPVRAARLLQQRSRMRRHLGCDGDVADLREAVRLVPAGHPARASLLAALSSRLMEVPLAEEAHAAAAQALGLARRIGDATSEAMALTNLATLDARGGDFAQLAHLVQARALAESAGAFGALMRAIHWEASLLEAYGEYGRAAEVARAGIAAATRAGLARTSGAVHAANLVNALIALGRWDDAVEVIDHTLELAPTPGLRALLVCARGVVAVARGDPDCAVAVDDARDAFAAGRFLNPNEALPLAGLEIELRLAEGRPADALAVVERALSEHDLQQSARFSWPLLAAGGRAARAAGAGADAERAAVLLDALRGHADKLPVVTRVQHAHASTFAAESAHADGMADRDAWDAAADAWREVGQPYPQAYALLNAAEAAARDRNRGGAAGRLRRAAELADRLEARPLRERAGHLARRARVVLSPRDIPDVDDPVADKARRRLGLTPREVEVLRMVADGRGNREIAEELFISVKTASVHVSNILAKLRVAGRGEAAATAHRLHLFDDQDPAQTRRD